MKFHNTALLDWNGQPPRMIRIIKEITGQPCVFCNIWYATSNSWLHKESWNGNLNPLIVCIINVTCGSTSNTRLIKPFLAVCCSYNVSFYQRRCMAKKRQALFRPIWPFPWLWDTELQVRQGLVIKVLLFWGCSVTLLKIDLVGTMSTPITAPMICPKIGLLPWSHSQVAPL